MMRAGFFGLCIGLSATFAALGWWQLQRLQEKAALVARVEARLAASPARLPAFDRWSPDEAYTRVQLSGEFLHAQETLVMAVTDLGPGWWVLAPLSTAMGHVLVNRGFVPEEMARQPRKEWQRPEGLQSLTGLLRASEPNGGFLRANVPDEDRWYSRDVQAIATARQLGPVAPYFVDADAADGDHYPRGGLTVVRFQNNHLIYAATWLVLAVGTGAAAVMILRKKG